MYENLGMTEVEKHSDELREYGRQTLLDIDGVNVIHSQQEIAGCTFGMYVDGVQFLQPFQVLLQQQLRL